MQYDSRGLALTTESPDAADALSLAAESFIGQKLDTMKHVNLAIEYDPNCTLAHIVKGLLIVGTRMPQRLPEAYVEFERAKAISKANEREINYLRALSALLDGRVLDAATHYEVLLKSYPRDLLAHRLVQMELFWVGESAWMRNIVERSSSEWSADTPGFSHFLALRAFANEENGYYESAEKYGRDSIDYDPTNGWGAHSVAHVMEMQGRYKDGIEWLDSLKNEWADLNNFVHHLWWHRSLFHLASGEYNILFDIYDRHIRNPDSSLIQANPGHYGDFQNCVDLLKHLDMCVGDVGGRWDPIADLAEERIGNHTAPLSSAHVAIALASADRGPAVERYLSELREFAANDSSISGARTRTSILPAAEGAIAHQRGDHHQVLEILFPARHSLWQIGGSHAQRNLFTQILANSAQIIGRKDILQILLEEMASRGFKSPAQRLVSAGCVLN